MKKTKQLTLDDFGLMISRKKYLFVVKDYDKIQHAY